MFFSKMVLYWTSLRSDKAAEDKDKDKILECSKAEVVDSIIQGQPDVTSVSGYGKNPKQPLVTYLGDIVVLTESLKFIVEVSYSVFMSGSS